jgi:hypothetical protein
VVRFSGGQAAGAGGILELVEENNSVFKLYDNKEGLYFTPFSPLFSQGELIKNAS